MKQVMGKTLFVIQPQSMVDVITNSSSELFVFHGKEKEVIEEMIKNIYPNYRDEYQSLKSLSELDDYDLENYLGWVYSRWDDSLSLSKHFNIEPQILYSNFDTINQDKYWYGDISSQGLTLIKEQLDMEHTYVLYSKYDNPDWDMQEELMCIGRRYHLG